MSQPDEERRAFRAYMKRQQRERRLAQYAKDIPLLQARIALAERRGEDAAYIRLLERKIAHRRQRLESGWPDE